MAYVNIAEIIYPVGSIICSTSSVSPSEIFGGTWKKIPESAYLSSIGAEESLSSSLGNNAYMMDLEQMPYHSHIVPSYVSSTSGSSHTQSRNVISYNSWTPFYFHCYTDYPPNSYGITQLNAEQPAKTYSGQKELQNRPYTYIVNIWERTA